MNLRRAVYAGRRTQPGYQLVPLLERRPHDRHSQIRQPLRTVSTMTEETAGETVTDILGGVRGLPLSVRQSPPVRQRARSVRDPPPGLPLRDRRLADVKPLSHPRLRPPRSLPPGLRRPIRQRTPDHVGFRVLSTVHENILPRISQVA